MTEHFSESELTCRCGCGKADMSPAFMAMLELMRETYNKPMIITSAYRCKAHNEAVGGSKLSPHMEGCAVDVLVSGADAYELLDLALIGGFTGVGLRQNGPHAKRFIHLDCATPQAGRPRPTIWTY